MAVRCFDSTEHTGYVMVAAVFLALFVVGLRNNILAPLAQPCASPRCYFVASRSHKARLGPLYCQYEADKWWFDCCVLTVKMLLAALW